MPSCWDGFSQRVVGWSIDSSQTAQRGRRRLGDGHREPLSRRRRNSQPSRHLSNSPRGPSLAELWTSGLFHPWGRSGTATTTARRNPSRPDASRTAQPLALEYRLELVNAIFELEMFNNRQRRHSSLGILSRSNTSHVDNRTRIKRADRAKPGAHESVHQSWGSSTRRKEEVLEAFIEG